MLGLFDVIAIIGLEFIMIQTMLLLAITAAHKFYKPRKTTDLRKYNERT